VRSRDRAIDRVELRALDPAPAGAATNILLVGTDAPTGGRSDTMVVVRVTPGSETTALFLPRDLWDAMREMRLNSALAGGPDALVAEVTALTGIPLDHYVQLDFAGFRDLVDELGGLPLAVDVPVSDRATGLQLEPASCAVLDGQTMLALTRARHLEVRDAGGVWTSDPTGDLGRIARGQALADAIVQQLTTIGPDPVALDRLSRVLADHAVVDSGLSLGRLVELATAIVRSGAVATDSVPVVPVSVPSGASVLEPAEGASAVFARYGSTMAAPGPGAGAAASTASAVVPVHACS
jgi:LCP family protein required for cell wall assembly